MVENPTMVENSNLGCQNANEIGTRWRVQNNAELDGVCGGGSYAREKNRLFHLARCLKNEIIPIQYIYIYTKKLVRTLFTIIVELRLTAFAISCCCDM